MELTHKQWNRLEPLSPSLQRKQGGRGRPRGNPSQGRPKRNPVDSSNWSTLERLAATVSLASNLSQVVPDLGPAGGVQTDPDRTGRGSLPARGHRYTGNRYRWKLHPRKKKGLCRHYNAWQRDEDHGNRSHFWSSCRH
jgi:hypothetical protein